MKKILALATFAFALAVVVGCDSPKTTPTSAKGTAPTGKM